MLREPANADYVSSFREDEVNGVKTNWVTTKWILSNVR